MKRAEIIAEVLKNTHGREAGLVDGSRDGLTYEQYLLTELERSLRHVEPDQDLPTCADFAHLEVKCCRICHVDYPQYELAVVELESGGRAWLCCSLDRALNPSKHAAMEQSPEWQDLGRLFSKNRERSTSS